MRRTGGRALTESSDVPAVHAPPSAVFRHVYGHESDLRLDDGDPEDAEASRHLNVGFGKRPLPRAVTVVHDPRTGRYLGERRAGAQQEEGTGHNSAEGIFIGVPWRLVVMSERSNAGNVMPRRCLGT
jgi:hypothetical protein